MRSDSSKLKREPEDLRDGSVVLFSIILTYDGGIEQQIWKPRFRRQEVEDKENFLKLVFEELTREEAENICVIDTCQVSGAYTGGCLDQNRRQNNISFKRLSTN